MEKTIRNIVVSTVAATVFAVAITPSSVQARTRREVRTGWDKKAATCLDEMVRNPRNAVTIVHKHFKATPAQSVQPARYCARHCKNKKQRRIFGVKVGRFLGKRIIPNKKCKKHHVKQCQPSRPGVYHSGHYKHQVLYFYLLVFAKHISRNSRDFTLWRAHEVASQRLIVCLLAPEKTPNQFEGIRIDASAKEVIIEARKKILSTRNPKSFGSKGTQSKQGHTVVVGFHEKASKTTSNAREVIESYLESYLKTKYPCLCKKLTELEGAEEEVTTGKGGQILLKNMKPVGKVPTRDEVAEYLISPPLLSFD